MKINDVTKKAIIACETEFKQLQRATHEKQQELIKLVTGVTGVTGFIGYEIKEDELTLRYPEVPMKKRIKALTNSKKK